MIYFRPAVVILLVLTLITGVVYPLLVTGVAQILFPQQANGSLLESQQTAVGSQLIGQNFTRPGYFWGRPSATKQGAYNPLRSGGSNLAANNPRLKQLVKQRVEALRAANPDAPEAVPVDLLTASGSGLDPHISVDAALYQINRIAAARQLSPAALQDLIEAHRHTPLPRFIGQEVLNVLELNLSLDKLAQP